MKRADTYSKILNWFFVLAVCYVLCVVFLPHVRIDVVQADCLLNKIGSTLFQLALSFISAFIFWIITVVYKECRLRAKSQWWIDHYLLQLCNYSRELLEKVGKDKQYNLQDVQQLFITQDPNDAEQKRKVLNSMADKLANMALLSLNTSAPLSEVEIELSGEIYTICKSLKDISDLVIIEDNIPELFKLINQLEILSNKLDSLASQSVKN